VRINSHIALLKLVPIAISILVSVTFVRANLYMFEEERFDDFTLQLTTGRGCLFWYETAEDDCLGLISPSPDVVREIMPHLIARDASFLLERKLVFAHANIYAETRDSIYPSQKIIGDNSYDIIRQQPPSKLTWRLFLPQGSKDISLITGLRVESPDQNAGDPDGGILFQITVSSDGEEKDILSRLLIPAKEHEGFQMANVDLTEYIGKTILLTLKASVGMGDTINLSTCWAEWLIPELEYK
jgi:hypothetical protein